MMYVPNVSLVSPETLAFAKCGINYWGVNDVFLIWFFLWMSQLKSSQMLCVTLEWSLLLHHLILHSDVLLVEVAVQVQEKGHGHFCVFKIHFLSDSRDGRAWQRPLANIWSNCRFRQITLFSPAAALVLWLLVTQPSPSAPLLWSRSHLGPWVSGLHSHSGCISLPRGWCRDGIFESKPCVVTLLWVWGCDERRPLGLVCSISRMFFPSSFHMPLCY